MVIIYKKILLAIDESVQSTRAIEKVIDFQKGWDCKVVLLHSVKHDKIPTDLFPISFVPPKIHRNLEEFSKKVGERFLKERKEIFSKAGLSIKTRLIEDEEPEVYIKKIVEQENFDLVVLGSNGEHSKLKEILLRKVSKEDMKNSPYDVLIVN
ncbi:MAG: universal stress protein [Candidatus Thorarchaeota archaeon]